MVLDERIKVGQVSRIDAFHAFELGCNASLLSEPGIAHPTVRAAHTTGLGRLYRADHGALDHDRRHRLGAARHAGPGALRPGADYA